MENTEKGITTAENYISDLFAKNGPDEYEYQQIFDLVDNLTDSEVLSFRKYMKPILNPNTIIGFSYTKPFGYNGDFFIIEKIYQRYCNPDKQYIKWDKYFHEFPAAIAVVNRKTMAIEMFEKLNNKANGDAKNVLILGSGPVSETFEFFEKNNDSTLQFDMLDLDKRAISFAKVKNAKYLNSMTFHHKNVIRFAPDKKYDMIWSAGLFDYFKEKHFVYLLKKYYEYLNEGGEMIIGNFDIKNPSKKIMEILGDWFLHHRSEDELKKYAIQAGIDKNKIDVFKEPLGINLFLRITK
ncbi:MAG: methyltransferase domain-containing protein [Bacteroidales bacterium]|nr:methyltransferase domain-containing protein [Bacteroidales bacterium]